MVEAASRPEVDATEVVVVGAGAAGSLMAAHLAEAGKAVTLLDAGPGWRMSDLTSSQIWSRRLRWGGAPVEVTGRNPYGFGLASGWGLGGATLHHYGTWPRLYEEDFKVRSLHGRGLDWPISYDDLRPWYDRVQEEVGLSGDAAAEVWRPPGAPYPLPPVAVVPQAKTVAKGFERLGMRTAPQPLAVLSEPYRGRPACIYDGWCDAGCPIGALWNPLVAYVPRARAAGASLVTHATALKVLSDGKRATGVVYADSGGGRHRIDAQVVVLAASAVQTPALLLNSASDRHPAGLANSSGKVGKYFMAHGIAAVYGLFEEETAPYLGVRSGHLTNADGYKKGSRPGHFGSFKWQIAPALKPNDLVGIATTRRDLYGGELTDFMARAVHHLGHLVALVEQLPEEDNRIELSDRRDANGMRLTRTVFGFSDDALRIWEHAEAEGMAVLRAAGARNPWSGSLGTTHMAGGTIMGSDPAASVTDSFGRTHDLPNLVIAGSGLFPTAGANNPTYTIHALSMRSIDHMIAHWSDFAG